MIYKLHFCLSAARAVLRSDPTIYLLRSNLVRAGSKPTLRVHDDMARLFGRDAALLVMTEIENDVRALSPEKYSERAVISIQRHVRIAFNSLRAGDYKESDRLRAMAAIEAAHELWSAVMSLHVLRFAAKHKAKADAVGLMS